MLLLGNLLRRNAESQALRGKTALIYRDRVTTYASLNQQANRIANALLEIGLRRGDRVAVLGRNSDRYVAIYFGLAKAGAIMVPVNFWHRPEEIGYTLRQSGSRFLLVENRFREVAEQAAGDPDLRRIAFDEWGDGSEPGLLGSEAGCAEPGIPVQEDDPHIILYTSGTTGYPKGATLTHRSHYVHAMGLALAAGNTPDDVGAVIYPLFHTGGPDCLVLPHVLLGATLVILDGGDPKTILEATVRHRITNLFCVPTVWRRILRELEERPCDVTSVRRCLGSSDTFPPDLLDRILAHFGAEVYVTYGLTEAGCILTVCRLTRDDRGKIGSVGRPIPTVEVRVVDPGMCDLPAGEVGEVVARGPSMMQGYWNMPDLTAGALEGGWLRTGDLARWDPEGYLFIAGRAKDMIISGGENIYPVEVERVLREFGGVRDAVVIGLPDPEWGESVLAVIVPEEGVCLSPQALTDFVRTRLAGFKKPRWVEFVDAIPVTAATGKVQKSVLRERYKKKYCNPQEA